MKERHKLFVIIVATRDGPFTKEIWAETVQLACGIAEISEPKGRPVSYELRGDIVGRCERCKCFVDSSEQFGVRRGEIICRDCK